MIDFINVSYRFVETISEKDPPQVLLEEEKARQQSEAIVFSFVSCVGIKEFPFFFIFVSNVLLNIPSLHSMVSLILKTTSVVLLETFVNFLQAYRGFHRNHQET